MPIRNVQENQVGLKFIGTHQLLVYVDYMNLVGLNIVTIMKNTHSLTDGIIIDVDTVVGPEVLAEKTKCMWLSCNQNENMAQFKLFRNDCNKSKLDFGGN
jgi:hypothetical protein